MPDNDVWPPKPALPDPLTEYDDVIAAKLAALAETKTRPSRLLLTKSLLEEKGLDLKQAYAFVADYCDRQDILVQPKTSPVMAWLGCLVPLSMFGLGVFNLWLDYRREAIMRLPHHHAAFLAIRREGLIVVCAILVLLLLNTIVMLPRIIRSLRKK